MKYPQLLKLYEKNIQEKENLIKEFQNIIQDKSTDFDTRLNIWESSPEGLKKCYKKLPKSKDSFTYVFSNIRNRLSHSGKIIKLSTGLMDDFYIYKHNRFEEAKDSASHLKTKKEFISFMEFVFKYNIGSFE